jgi:WbqC-like protein family
VIVAAHQPHYFPWLGYIHKMAQADVFIVMDDLQYEKDNFQNRNRIKVNNSSAWITVPLERGSQTDLICDKLIRNDGVSAKEHWQRRTWTTLQIHYRKAPHFARYADQLEDLFTRPWTRLVDLTLHILDLVRGWFGISRPLLRSSSLQLEGQKTDRIIDFCRKVGAKVYLSGRGGSTTYLDVDALRRAGVTVAWQSFDHPVYPQRYPALGFLPRMCVLDILFNCGPASRDILLSACERRIAG